jgi:hypothetical protein
MQLSFQNLLEVRLVNELREKGVPWVEIRKAARRAAQFLNTPHPFVSHRFLTDGRRVFIEFKDDFRNEHLLHLATEQYLFQRLVRPHLRGIEFDKDRPVRWWPLGERRSVVLDPARSFGRPIGPSSGVATHVLAAHAACTSARQASLWYQVPLAEVRDAVAFESRLRAA